VSGGVENPVLDYEPDANFTNLPFNFKQPWIGTVVEDFNVYMEFDFLLTPNKSENEITVPLLLQNGVTYPQKVSGELLLSSVGTDNHRKEFSILTGLSILSFTVGLTPVHRLALVTALNLR
jgi:hypothetical protein